MKTKIVYTYLSDQGFITLSTNKEGDVSKDRFFYAKFPPLTDKVLVDSRFYEYRSVDYAIKQLVEGEE